MSKHFRPWKIDQTLLLPPSVHDFVPKGHVARFIVALVRDELDLSEIEAAHPSILGQPPFDPRLMTALLLAGYVAGIYSSRRLQQACEQRTDFIMIAALDVPDFRTIAAFRKRHLKALAKLFLQVLKLCEKAGLVKLGHVALDGTKIKANASKHKAMSYERMKKREDELQAEVQRLLDAAAAADESDEAAFGPDKRGDELPDWVADRQKRSTKIQAARLAIEAEAKAMAEDVRRIEAEKQKQRDAEGRKKPGTVAAPPSDEPDPKAQKNFTDPDSRIMKSKDGFVQAYNAQAAVDASAQVIVEHGLTQNGSDQGQLVAMTDGIEKNLGRKPEQLSVDAGYCSESNVKALETRGIDGYVAAGRAKHASKSVVGTSADGAATIVPQEPVAVERIGPPTRLEAMREKLRTGGYDSPYRLRKQVVEPVFGQIKQARGFRQFFLRGVENVSAEWALVCTAHNLTKLFKGRIAA